MDTHPHWRGYVLNSYLDQANGKDCNVGPPNNYLWWTNQILKISKSESLKTFPVQTNPGESWEDVINLVNGVSESTEKKKNMPSSYIL